MIVLLKHKDWVEQSVELVEARSERVRVEFLRGPNKGRRIIVDREYVEGLPE